MSDIDAGKLNALVGKMLGDLGGAFSVPTGRIGYRLVCLKLCTSMAP